MRGFQALDTFHNSKDDSSIDMVETSLERQKHFAQFKNAADALPCHIHFLHACASWALTAELQRRIRAMEIRGCHKILCISYKDHVTSEDVCAKIQQAIRPHEDFLTILKRRKLQWYGQVSRSSGLAKPIFQGTVKGGRRQGRQKERMDWHGVRQVPEGSGEQRKREGTGCLVLCLASAVEG